jgi:uncharacterized protein (TIGR02118 family)
MKKGMIKVIALYPSGDGKTFDMDYYINKHIPMAAGLLGDAVKGLTVEKGLAGAAPDLPVPYVAVANTYFDSIQAFQTAFGSHHMDALKDDVSNYTNIEPITLISEVMI